MENTQGHKVDLRQSPAYAKYMTSIGWEVVAIDKVQVFIKPLGILGSLAKIQRAALPLPKHKILKLLKKRRTWMTKLEPLNSGPAPIGFYQDKNPLIATKTLRIDLTPSLKTIQQRLKKDARYALRKAEKNRIYTIRDNFLDFYFLFKYANMDKKLWTPSWKHFDKLVSCFGSNCFCIIINHQAAALVLVHDQIAYYYYAGSYQQGKKQHLPYLVVWECIKEAKRRGCTTWDWEGIYDPRWPNKSWQGFTHFKRSFGGYEVDLPGSFTRWF